MAAEGRPEVEDKPAPAPPAGVATAAGLVRASKSFLIVAAAAAVALALFLAGLLEPAVSWLGAHRWPRPAAATVVVLTFVGTLAATAMIVTPRIVQRAVTAAAAAGARVWETVKGYMRGVVVIALVDAALVALLLIVAGTPLVPPLAVLTFAGAFFPLVGAFTAGLVAVAVSFATGGLTDALVVGAGIVAIQQLEGNLLQPAVTGRAVNLHPTVVMVVLGTGTVAGIVGAFVAVPLTAAATAAVPALRRNAIAPRSVEGIA